MKKYTLTLAALIITTAASATVLRVNNNAGSTAPYSDLSTALKDAVEGDTIMVEGSEKSYGNFKVTKRIVLMGPGYMQVENGLVSEGVQSAKIDDLALNAKDVQVQGLHILDGLDINADGAVVTRCYICDDGYWHYGIRFSSETKVSNCIIHKNHIASSILGREASHITITNNIFNIVDSYDGYGISDINESYIANNSWLQIYQYHNMYSNIYNTTIEKNIHVENSLDASVSYQDNLTLTANLYTDTSSELAIRDDEQGFSEGKYGAFAGDDPYVISGIPAGPVIEDITVPASVEQGRALNITIKLGLQQ